MAKYYVIPTNIGRAKLANATITGQPVVITHMAVGDGGGQEVTPTGAMTALTNEVYRAGVNNMSIDPENPAYMIFQLVIPVAQGGWFIREAGIFDSAGDLIAVGNTPESYKPQLAEGAGSDFDVNLILEVAETSAITVVVNPAMVLATKSDIQTHAALVAAPGKYGHLPILQGNEGDVLTLKNGQLVLAPIEPYRIGQYVWFEDEEPVPGMLPLVGAYLENFSRYPDAQAYFRGPYGSQRLVTLAEYQARHIAIWHTNADGSTVGWEGEGGVNVFVWDEEADTLLVPDVSGMTRVAASSALGVGGVQGWGTPRIKATFDARVAVVSSEPTGAITRILYNTTYEGSNSSRNAAHVFDSGLVTAVPGRL